MFKKIVSSLVVLSILGYFLLHDASHVRENSSVDSFHFDSTIGHQCNHLLEIVDHHENPFQQEHAHLDNLFSIFPKQKDFKGKSDLLLAHISKSFQVPTPNIPICLVPDKQGINHFPPFNFRSSPLRI